MSDFSGNDGGFGFNAPPPPPPPPNMSAPPGYVPYGGQNYGAYSSFQSIGGVAKWLAGLVIAIIPIQAISALLLSSMRSKAQDYLDGNISSSEYTSSAAPVGLISLLSGALVISIVVLTMIWMSRMAKNQQAMNRAGQWGPGWAVGGWFCPPCVLYIIPFLMFRDLWKSSDPDSQADWRRNTVAPIVTVWWVLYGLLPIAFFSVTIGTFKLGASTTEAARNLDDSFTLSLLSSVVQIAAAVAYLMLVRQLTARHKLATREA